MIPEKFLDDLSLYQKELSLRIFDLVISKVLKNAYANFDEKTKEDMEIIFDSENTQRKEEFIKNNIPNFNELFENEIKKIENDIRREIEKKI